MPDFSIFKIFQIFGIVSTWATKAFADGKVTLPEAAELAFDLCAILGIPTQLALPAPDATGKLIPGASGDPDKLPETAQQGIPLHGPPGETDTAL